MSNERIAHESGIGISHVFSENSDLHVSVECVGLRLDGAREETAVVC